MKNIIAIDVGATNTRVGLVDNLGTLHQKKAIKTDRNSSTFINSLISLISEMDVFLDDIDSIGVAIAGNNIDQKKGILIKSPNLPFKNLKIVEPLKNYYKKQVLLNNDTNAAAIGEKVWGAGKKTSNFLYLTFSSGIGGAAFVDGSLVEPEKGNSIEPGHIEIPSDYNLPCGCGGRNHWESYVSGFNLPIFLKAWSKKNKIKLDFDDSSVFTIFEAIKSDDENALKFFEQMMAIHEEGINILSNQYRSDLILIGGSVYLKNQVIFGQYFDKIFSGKITIKPATFGDNASLIGVAAVFFL